MAPLLSVTVNSNRYTPCTKLFKAVVALLTVVMLPLEGPDIFAQAKLIIVPSASVPMPVKFAILEGEKISVSIPAFATGAIPFGSSTLLSHAGIKTLLS